MVIGIIGESCTGKSTVAKMINQQIPCEIYTGKDYLRLAKNEETAIKIFKEKLDDAINGKNVIYVISEPKHLNLLPEKAIRILVTADLEQIKERFAKRMNGTLPPPVKNMLEQKHGCFDDTIHNIHIISGETEIEDVYTRIKELM